MDSLRVLFSVYPTIIITILCIRKSTSWTPLFANVRKLSGTNNIVSIL